MIKELQCNLAITIQISRRSHTKKGNYCKHVYKAVLLVSKGMHSCLYYYCQLKANDLQMIASRTIKAWKISVIITCKQMDKATGLLRGVYQVPNDQNKNRCPSLRFISVLIRMSSRITLQLRYLICTYMTTDGLKKTLILSQTGWPAVLFNWSNKGAWSSQRG